MNPFVEQLHEVFAALGQVHIKRMFGGHGVFHDGLMCGLVAQNTLYLKCDALTAVHFEALGLAPFVYLRQGQPTPLSYRQAPETVFEDPAEASLWCRRAFEAALRTANAKARPTVKARRGTKAPQPTGPE